MKYIKLFEKFDSTILTSVLSFLSKKISKDQYTRFLEYLQTMLHEYNIPISSIKDSDVQYLSYNKALAINSRRTKGDENEIHYLKYWFSLEKGFVDVTKVGNRRMNFNELNATFTPKILNWLYGRYGIGGKVKPVKEISKMKTGDKILVAIVGEFTSYEKRNFTSYVAIGELYVDDRNPDDIKYYLWSDCGNADGNTPYRVVNGIERPQNRYDYSYALFEGEYCELHSITGDDDKLSMSGSDKKKSPWDFNLPLQGEWTDTENVKRLDVCDFAIVLKVNAIEKNLPEIRKNRENIKSGALALASDDKVKRKNIKRYFDILFKRLNITKDNDFSNLNKVILTCIVGNKFLLFGRNSWMTNKLHDFIRSVDDAMSNTSDEYVNYFAEKMQNNFINNRKNEQAYLELFRSNMDITEKMSGDPNIKRFLEIVDKFIEVGDYISDYYKNHSVTTLEDLQAEYSRLRSVEDIIDTRTHGTSGVLNGVLMRICTNQHNYFRSILDFVKDYNEEMYQSDLIKIARLEKYVKLVIK